jgi:hypothetical protein
MIEMMPFGGSVTLPDQRVRFVFPVVVRRATKAATITFYSTIILCALPSQLGEIHYGLFTG